MSDHAIQSTSDEAASEANDEATSEANDEATPGANDEATPSANDEATPSANDDATSGSPRMVLDHETSPPPRSPRGSRPPLDHEGLLAALVLAPATYSRNRFFDMYRDPEVRRVRRRAIQLRSVIEHLVCPGNFARQDRPGKNGLIRLHYEVPTVGLRRTIALAPLEVSLLRCAVARAKNGGASLAAGDPDRLRIEEALSRLAPVTTDIPLLAPPV